MIKVLLKFIILQEGTLIYTLTVKVRGCGGATSFQALGAFFPGICVLFHQHSYITIKVFYYILTSYHRKTLNNISKYQ